MSLEIKIRPPLDFVTTRRLVDQLAVDNAIASADAMNQLVQSALALRHAAHLARAFAAWITKVPADERATLERLIAGLTLESASDSDGRIDDHGGYRGVVSYELMGAARVVGFEHFYGYDNLEMDVRSSVRLEDRGPSPARKGGKKKLARLEDERVALDPPWDTSLAVEQLFAFLGPEEALSPLTKQRFLLRLLFPWGRYLHGYDGLPETFYDEADRLYALSPSKRAKELKARDDDGEVIPFFTG